MNKFAVKALFLSLAAFLVFSLSTRQVFAATIVNTSNSNGWSFLHNSSGGSVTFVSGPVAVPSGTGSGSVRLFTGSAGNQPSLVYTSAFNNTKIDNTLTRLEYSTFSQSTGSSASLYPNLIISVDTPVGPDVLRFDPHDQTGATLNTWQTWTNAQNGFWRSQNFGAFPGGSLSEYKAFVDGFGGGDILITDSNGQGGIKIQAGPTGAGDVHDENVSHFTIGINGSDTTYDFDPDTASNNYSQSFYSDNNFTTQVGTSTNVGSLLKYNWGLGSPAAGVPVDNFSAKWEGTYDFNAGKYNFVGTSDNHLKVTVDGVLVFDKQSKGPGTGARLMTAGVHTVKVEYVHGTGASNVAFAMYPLPTNVFPFVGDCYDLNGDHIVNSGDQGFLASMVGTTGPVNTLAGDLNNDGTINSGDQAILASKVNKPCPY